MPTTWRNRGGVERGFKTKFRRDMEASAEAAARAMEDIVMASGRERTGDMMRAPIEASKVNVTAQTYRVSWGWSLAERQAHSDRMTSNREPYRSYYDLQDLGFTHRFAGPIEGMHAQEQSRRVFVAEMRKRGW